MELKETVEIILVKRLV